MHRIAAYLFHGEQVIPMLIAALLVILVVLTALAYLLVRLSRRRLGKRSLLLALLPFVIFVIGAWMWVRSQAPKVLSGAAVSGMMNRLPDYSPFSLTGAAYFGDRLYVGSNVGLLEIHNGAVATLFQTQKSDSVVEGPWFDRADHLLWVMDDHTHELLNFNFRAGDAFLCHSRRKGTTAEVTSWKALSLSELMPVSGLRRLVGPGDGVLRHSTGQRSQNLH